jgi:hypothetical protein
VEGNDNKNIANFADGVREMIKSKEEDKPKAVFNTIEKNRSNRLYILLYLPLVYSKLELILKAEVVQYPENCLIVFEERKRKEHFL